MRFSYYYYYYYHYYYNILLLLLLLLLAAMTYNQIQFQINDYANHYVDMKLLNTEGCTAKVLQVEV